jgi:hypothetical protein
MPSAYYVFMFSFVFAACATTTGLEGTGPADYQDPASWASLPTKDDPADQVPVRLLKDQQREALVDVFFVHPTTYYGRRHNASLANRAVTRNTNNGPIKHQASVFNGSCRIYAPRYRQATLKAFTKPVPWRQEALDLAYSDIRSAFDYYLKHFNEGRPFVIASHSQGTYHAIRLINDLKDNEALDRLVTAYLVGRRIECDELPIPICEQPNQTGCFSTWNTAVSGARAPSNNPGCCTNPLNWMIDGAHATKDDHKGSVPITFDRIDLKLLDAKCVNGMVWINADARTGYVSLGKNFHLMDYNLFYLNLRRNVQDRIDEYFRLNGSE